MKRTLCFVVFAFSCAQAIASAAPALKSNSPLQNLQSVAVRIERGIAGASAGQSPPAKDIQGWQRALDQLASFAHSDATSAFAHKYNAVAVLLGKLKYLVEHKANVPHAESAQLSENRIDNESVGLDHGAECASALGISNGRPVMLTLGTAGQAGSDAWLRFDPPTNGTAMFTTESAGADPGLELFRNCLGAPIASNDDAFGLDASASVAAQEHVPLFAHLTNSGASGMVLISVNGNTASIGGTVTDRITHQPIIGAYVQLVSEQGGFYGSANTDQNGSYQLSSVFSGSFYIRAIAQSYVSELYPTAYCLPGYYDYSTDGCDVANAQIITVQDGQAIPDIDFTLYSGQQIAGKVLDSANQPLADSPTLNLFDDQGIALSSVNADAAGNYAFASLPPHAYKIEVVSSNYTSQMYDHVACGGVLQNQCDLANANVIQLTNADLVGVDFNVTRLASIRGTVNDAHSSHIAYAQITVVDSNGSIVGQTNSDYFSGAYNAGPLGIGSYRVYVTASGYFSQAYAGLDCVAADCAAELVNATPVAITQLAQQAQADFSLQSVPAFTGHVQDSHHRPLQGISISASTNPPSLQPFGFPAQTSTDQNGNYSLQLSQSGQYFIWALSNTFIDQIYPGIVCENFNDNYFYPSANCNVSAAVLLKLSPGNTPGTFDFTLDPSARIAGNVAVYAGPGSQIAAGATVTLYDGADRALETVQTDTQGNYYFGDLPPGNYYAEATGSYNAVFYSQVWPALNCGSNCIPTSGAPIVVTPTTSTTGIDFSLIELDAVVGRVTDAQGGPVVGGVVDLFGAPDGRYQNSFVTDEQGFYVARGNGNGSYFVATETGSQYVDQVFSGVSCPLGSAYYGLCPLSQGTLIALSPYGTQPHIANFVLQRQDKLFANSFE
jgi:Carboxypeptidase regulatory-like domain/Prealbumin-like fold domain